MIEMYAIVTISSQYLKHTRWFCITLAVTGTLRPTRRRKIGHIASDKRAK